MGDDKCHNCGRGFEAAKPGVLSRCRTSEITKASYVSMVVSYLTLHVLKGQDVRLGCAHLPPIHPSLDSAPSITLGTLRKDSKTKTKDVIQRLHVP